MIGNVVGEILCSDIRFARLCGEQHCRYHASSASAQQNAAPDRTLELYLVLRVFQSKRLANTHRLVQIIQDTHRRRHRLKPIFPERKQRAICRGDGGAGSGSLVEDLNFAKVLSSAEDAHLLFAATR